MRAVLTLGMVMLLAQMPMAAAAEATPVTAVARGVGSTLPQRLEVEVSTAMPLAAVLSDAEVSDGEIAAIQRVLDLVFPSTELPEGSLVRLLYGNAADGSKSVWRVSVYLPMEGEVPMHRATIAANDQGQYVIGLEPGWDRPTDEGEVIEGKQGRY